MMYAPIKVKISGKIKDNIGENDSANSDEENDVSEAVADGDIVVDFDGTYNIKLEDD